MSRNKLSNRINNNINTTYTPSVVNNNNKPRRGLSNRLQQLDQLIRQK